jgi:hypothetical protein
MDPAPNTDTQTFRWLDADGKEIMSGSLSSLAEHLPDTPARDAALSSMLKTAAEAVEAEQRRDEALASTAQMISDAVTRLTHRMDAYVERQEEQQRRDEEEALRQEQEEIQRMLNAGPDPDAPDPLDAVGDDGDLTLKHSPHEIDPERYDPKEDAEGEVKPVLSYPRVPLSYVKRKDTDLRLTDPIPFDPDAPGAAPDPEPGPEPGSRLSPPLPQVAQPTAISLNEE